MPTDKERDYWTLKETTSIIILKFKGLPNDEKSRANLEWDLDKLFNTIHKFNLQFKLEYAGTDVTIKGIRLVDDFILIGMYKTGIIK